MPTEQLAQLGSFIRQLLVNALPAGSKIYAGMLPGLAEKCVAVQMYEGQQPTRYFGSYSPTYRPMAKIITRAKTHAEAAQLCDAARVALDGYHSANISIVLSGSPMSLGPNEQLGEEFQELFQLTVQ